MSEPLENGNGRVSYTVKELLAKIDERSERIEKKLDAKAERVTVEGLERRVTSLERWRYGIGLLATAAGVLAGVVGPHYIN